MEEDTNPKPESNKNLIGIVLAILIFLAAAGYFFIKNNKTETTSDISMSKIESEAMEKEPSGSPAGEVKEFTIDGSSFKFEPEKIEVNKGDTVKITFKDQDGMHNLVIDGYNVQTKIIKGGTEDTIQFVADKSGSFEYYCSVGNHKEQGMMGTLVVK